jgi:NAD(P)H-dependent FMN reductase
MSAALRALVILGSTREGRFGDKPAHWIRGVLEAHGAFEAELVDLRDWPLPFFDHPRAPSRVTDGHYGNEVADRWAQRVGSADAFVIVSPEYNHGYSAVVKNALDWCYREWNKKPVAFVGYGGTGGARAIEQLRQVAVELDMAPVRAAVHVPLDVYRAVMGATAPADPALFAPVDTAAKTMTDQLAWWARALAAARAATA